MSQKVGQKPKQKGRQAKHTSAKNQLEGVSKIGGKARAPSEDRPLIIENEAWFSPEGEDDNPWKPARLRNKDAALLSMSKTTAVKGVQSTRKVRPIPFEKKFVPHIIGKERRFITSLRAMFPLASIEIDEGRLKKKAALIAESDSTTFRKIQEKVYQRVQLALDLAYTGPTTSTVQTFSRAHGGEPIEADDIHSGGSQGQELFEGQDWNVIVFRKKGATRNSKPETRPRRKVRGNESKGVHSDK